MNDKQLDFITDEILDCFTCDEEMMSEEGVLRRRIREVLGKSFRHEVNTDFTLLCSDKDIFDESITYYEMDWEFSYTDDGEYKLNGYKEIRCGSVESKLRERFMLGVQANAIFANKQDAINATKNLLLLMLL